MATAGTRIQLAFWRVRPDRSNPRHPNQRELTLFRIAVIAALAPNQSIGHADSLPWKMPRDMQFFRRTTSGHVVVMGRNTFESLGCRPLPKRVNVILTRSKSYEGKNVFVARSLDEAIDIARLHTKKERMFVIGGGSVYSQTITLADELFLTQLQPQDPNQPALFGEEFYGDTFFPQVPARGWDLCHVSRRYRALDSMRPSPEPEAVKHYFRFFKYGRRSTCGCTSTEKTRVAEALKSAEARELPIRVAMPS
jgi:dihydrofolate reductase